MVANGIDYRREYACMRCDLKDICKLWEGNDGKETARPAGRSETARKIVGADK